MNNVYADASSVSAPKKVLDGFVSKRIQCETVDGRYNGSGIEILFKDNVEYSLVCDWENDRKNGSGVIFKISRTMGESSLFLMGDFVNDELEGRVRIFHESNQEVRMEGQAVNGMWSGSIEYYDEDGNEMENGEESDQSMDDDLNSDDGLVIVNVRCTSESSTNDSQSISLCASSVSMDDSIVSSVTTPSVSTSHPTVTLSTSRVMAEGYNRPHPTYTRTQRVPLSRDGEGSFPPLSRIPKVVEYWKIATPAFVHQILSLFLVVFCVAVSWVYMMSTLILSVCLLLIHLLLFFVFRKPSRLEKTVGYIYLFFALEGVLGIAIGIMLISLIDVDFGLVMWCVFSGIGFLTASIMGPLVVGLKMCMMCYPAEQRKYIDNHPAAKWCYCIYCISCCNIYE